MKKYNLFLVFLLSILVTNNTNAIEVFHNSQNPNNVDSIISVKKSFDSVIYIPDGPDPSSGVLPSCIEKKITFSEFKNNSTIISASDIISVCINIEHSFLGDLNIDLVCPNGSVSNLKRIIQYGINFLGIPYGGVSHNTSDSTSITQPINFPGHGFTYCFSNIMNQNQRGLLNNCPQILVADSSVLADYCYTCDSTNRTNSSGYYQPEIAVGVAGTFSSLIGCPLNGDWMIRICDNQMVDNGFMFSWDLELKGVKCSNYSISYTDTICKGQIYNLHGFNADSTGVYTQNLQTYNGCDSIISLNLFVYPSYSQTLFDTICQGQLYNNYGFSFIADTTGLYTQSLQTIDGCDSIINLNLAVISPSVPANVTANLMQDYIELVWEGNAVEYDIYRDDSLVANTSLSNYIDSNLVDSVEYCYKVKAIIDECESDVSESTCKTFVGLQDIKSDTETSVYPNPTTNRINFYVKQNILGSAYTITNTIGDVILSGNLNIANMSIDLSQLPKGLYFMNIEKTHQSIKIIKQ